MNTLAGLLPGFASPVPATARLPWVSIVVLNYKRRDALALCLSSVLAQTYIRRDIIVVDNHSEDGAEEMVRALDPAIHWIGLPQNLGSCAGRNAGLRQAQGDLIVTLDNDVLFASPAELARLVDLADRRPDSAVFAMQVCDQATGKIRGREWCHPKSRIRDGSNEFESSFFPEGAVAFRREALDHAGLYYEPFFIGCEGGDLAIRILDQGFKILYSPSVRVVHLMEPETRTADRPYYFYTRNYIWIAYKNYRLWPGVQYAFPKLLMMAAFSLRTGTFSSFVRGVKDACAGLSKVRPDRKPVGSVALRHFGDLERDRPGWIARLARHRLQPEI